MTTAQHSSPIFPLARILSWRAHAVANATATASSTATANPSAGQNNTGASSKSPRHVPSLLPSSAPCLNSIPESTNGSNGSRSRSPESTPPSPKPSPRRVLGNLKPEVVLDCSSGDVPKTHSAIVDAGAECKQSTVVVHHDSFLCQDAVNTTRLLTLSRKRVLDKVAILGGNTIVDERWSCTVHKHESKREIKYKVTIMYRGIPARSHLSDPEQPISLHEVKSIPGLMTIVSRHSKYESLSVPA